MLFRMLPTSTAEGVAFGRHMLSHAGVLNEQISRVFFPWKSWWWTKWQTVRMRFTKGRLAGATSHLSTRTWFYDGNFAKLVKPDSQIVLCGSGYDARPWRLHMPRGVQWFDVDLPEHPGVQNRKMRAIKKHKLSMKNITFCPIDFKKDTLSDVLKNNGHDATKPTVFLLEGVTMYLNDEAISTTVKAMQAVAAPGSYLMCELFDAFLLTGEGRAHKDLSLYWKFVSGCREPYSFGVVPEEMGAFWEKLGCKVVTHYKPEEQRAEWVASPHSEHLDDGQMPHAGICHLFLIQLTETA